MKSNGKNLIMFTYQVHDYMDERPETEFRTAESQEVANKIISALRSSWASGTVSDPKEVTPEEYAKARMSSYWKGYESALDNLALDCTQDWLDEYSTLINNK